MNFSEENKITEVIIGEAIKVHNELGPGLLEKVYEECLFYLLTKHGFSVQKQVYLPVSFEGVDIDAGFKLDLIVENKIIIELKAVEKLLPIHQAQLYTYLKLSKKNIGLLMNFNEKLLKNGIKRLVMS